MQDIYEEARRDYQNERYNEAREIIREMQELQHDYN